jgi:anti-anti-sigma regulatory factor
MISLDRTNGTPRVLVKGNLDAGKTQALDDALGKLDMLAEAVVALDECSRLDKSALPVLVRHHRRLKGRLTVVADPRTHPGRLLQTTGLDRLLHVVPPGDHIAFSKNGTV